jgi:hypothetical protein
MKVRKKIKEEKSEKLIDVDSILRKSKSQLLKDGDKPQVVPSYVKLRAVPRLLRALGII